MRSVSLMFRHSRSATAASSAQATERCRWHEDLEVEITDICPDAGPGTEIEFQYDDGSGSVTASFDLERSYTNFVLYLYEKLQPVYFAIMVEVNIFKEFCPANGRVRN